MQRVLALTAAACLLAAPLALAQSPPPAPTQQQVPQPQPAPPPTNPAPSPAPAPAPQAQTPAPSAEPQGCRTRQEAGQQCACLSDPSRIGTSTTNAAGQNICVRPD